MTPEHTLGKYELTGRLARGGMGVVFVGRNPDLDHTVAIKVLRTDVSVPDAAERFLAEARALSRLKHPNIVRVYDTGRDGTDLFIVMELIRGRTLKDVLDNQPEWTVRDRLDVFGQICGAIDHAHREGLIHRDLKPANIMLDADDGLVKVLDFGLAKPCDVGGQGGTIAGTPSYMAPEQMIGAPITAGADVFAATAILFEMLTGRKAFPHGHDRRPAADLVRESSLSPAVAAVIERGLATAVEHRWPSIAELHDAVETAMRSAPGDAFAATSVTATSVRATLVREARPDNSSNAPTLRTRRRIGPLIIAAVAVLGLLVAAWFGWERFPRSVPEYDRVEIGGEPRTRPAPASSEKTSRQLDGNAPGDAAALPPAQPPRPGIERGGANARSTTGSRDTGNQQAPAEHVAAVERVVRDYAAAQSRLDATAAAALRVDRPTQELEQAFARYSSLEITLDSIHADVLDDRARVTARERRTVTTVRGSSDVVTEFTVYELQRVGDGWRIRSRRVE